MSDSAFKVKNGLISYGNIVPSGNYSIGADGNEWQNIHLLSGDIQKTYVNEIQFETDETITSGITHAIGKLHWNANDQTLEVGLPSVGGDDVILQIGQESVFLAKNDTGSQINNGSAVCISGSLGDRPKIVLADYTDSDRIDVAGLATENIPDGAVGYVTSKGLVRGLKTDYATWTVGDRLYLNASGGLSNTHPTMATAGVVIIGTIVRVHANDGIILVHTPQKFTLGNNFNGTLRNSIINKNAGANAGVGFTAINDANHKATFGMAGTNNTAFGGAEAAVYYNEGYGPSVFAVDGNKNFEWYIDRTDSHANSALLYPVMKLTPSGELQLNGNLVPSGSYTLGTSANPWQELFVTSGSIYMDGDKLSVSDGNLLFNDDNLNKNIIVDTTYYVGPSGSDTTGDGTSGNPYATINKAIDMLDGYSLFGDITIQLLSGNNTNHTTSIAVDHPNGDKITIAGQAYTTTTLTSISGVVGSSNDYSVKLNLADATGIEINDYVHIGLMTEASQWAAGTAYAVGAVRRPTAADHRMLWFRCKTSGTSHSVQPTWVHANIGDVTTEGGGTVTWEYVEPRFASGVYKVTAKSGNMITVLNKAETCCGLIDEVTTVAAPVNKYNSIVTLPSASSFLNLLSSRRLKKISTILFLGNAYNNYNIMIQENSFAEISYCGFIDVPYAIYVNNARCSMSVCAFSNFTYTGITILACSDVYLDNVILNGNPNALYVLSLNNTSRCSTKNMYIIANNYGVYTNAGSTLRLDSDTVSAIVKLNTVDSSPAFNTVGNRNSYIDYA